MIGRPLHRASRNADLGLLHETFFICAVTTILCIRTDLWLTNYPQLGGHGLHIAHLLYGGALMLVALAFLLTLLGRRVRWVAAIVGGIGFGFFIDELGKFITADNNYFFRPAAGIIYLVFIVLFLASRAYQRRRGLTEDERVRNAFELIAEASIGPWQAGSRARALTLLGAVEPTNPLRASLLALADGIDATPDPAPPFWTRWSEAIARRYEAATRTDWFRPAVISVFVLWATISLIGVFALVLPVGFEEGAARAGERSDAIAHLSFLNWGSLVSSAPSGVPVFPGLSDLARGDRPQAYVWLTRALLVSILITRVFSFVESQFGAVFGLGIDILLLISVQAMARQEERRL
ncbi:MAG: hypothetical protein JST59_30995 [Actinobacteria bacterium]|nr:hypothetical protein [Actinomycetota bacterium]